MPIPNARDYEDAVAMSQSSRKQLGKLLEQRKSEVFCRVLHPGMMVEDCWPSNGYEFSLEELKTAIGGGYIEIVRLYRRDEWGNPLIMIVDEDGIRKQLPVNHHASELYGKDYIYGPALVCPAAFVS